MMPGNSRAVRFFYGTVVGRAALRVLQDCGFSRFAAAFLRSPISRPLVGWYIKRHDIPMEGFEGMHFHSFQEFFARKRKSISYDAAPGHLISPCDGWLSAYSVESSSVFTIKGSRYRVCDLLQNTVLAGKYDGGLCLVIRLCPSDYHHYCCIDDGYHGKNHFIEGELHSVQPIACETYPVYVRNRRAWTLLKTEHFGYVVQVEVGALIVGGICCERESVFVGKGEEMGHFELAGSTIVLLFEKNRVLLLPRILNELEKGHEFRVKQGMWIGEQYQSQKGEEPGAGTEDRAGTGRDIER